MSVKVLRRAFVVAAVAAASLPVGAPGAAADSVAYIDDHDVWVASPDGRQKARLTSAGSSEAPYLWPSQDAAGTTVAVRRSETERLLERYGSDGNLVGSSPLPHTGEFPVFPLGLDLSWDGATVAYGYQHCTSACQSTVSGWWLADTDGSSTVAQGQSGLSLPAFYGSRVMSADGVGRIFVQSDVPEAPYTTQSELWLTPPEGRRFVRVDVARTGRLVAIEWYQEAPEVARGITVARHSGVIPGALGPYTCELPVSGEASHVTFSPDGSHLAWRDAEGIKVAGAPDMTAGTDTCTLTSPANVISSTGTFPHFGGASVEAIRLGCTIVGGPTGDVLEGTSGRDVICGFGGKDTIDGLGRDDVLIGGAGSDDLDGGGGADALRGGSGADELTGGEGRDVIDGLGGTDQIHARDGVRDSVDGGPGQDRGRFDEVDTVRAVEKAL